MKIRFIISAALTMVAGLSTSYLYYSNQSPEGSNVENPSEPNLAAASHGRTISYLRRENLSFGGLVAGVSDRFIELRPNGDVYASGEIENQSVHSRIGAMNTQEIAKNPLYRIRPGRLTFNIESVAENETISVHFKPGELDTGITLSNLNLKVGAESSASLMRIPGNQPNRLDFRATSSATPATVDIVYGARLDLASNIRGDVSEEMNVEISISGKTNQRKWIFCAKEHQICHIPVMAKVRYGANGKYRYKRGVTGSLGCNNHVFGDPIRHTFKQCYYQTLSALPVIVYEHVNYRGSDWKLGEGRYSHRSVRRSPVKDDKISSIKIAQGYKVRACEHNFKGKCHILTTSTSDLRRIGFNDKISSIEVFQ